MKKYLLSVLFIFLGLNTLSCFSACGYQSEIDQCIKANGEKGGARKITEFVCAETNNVEKIAYQIIFDKKFREIDGDIENFLTNLQNSVQYFYGPEKSESYLDGINYINETFNPNGTLWKRYNKFCLPSEENSIIKNYYECIGGEENDKEGTVKEGAAYFSQSNCQDLVEYKLFIYKKVAYNLLQVNKLDYLKEFRKKQLKSTREKYDEVVGNMYTNIDYIIRIANARNKVTKQCQYIAPDP
ncbi:hypothetical protein EOM39_03680 [Candidatus Gracilibacteria bacterium]|nr:hypothetical protein [Candidatus Gracilibacteria bacterium]